MIGRGKCTGRWKNWFNIRREDGTPDHSVDLEAVDFKMLNGQEEEIMAMNVPRSEQNSEQCLNAKLEELKKLQDFKTFEIVPDIGQDRISTTWVLTIKDSEVRARLVARGFEEVDDIPKDSPTMAKSTLRGKDWRVQYLS